MEGQENHEEFQQEQQNAPVSAEETIATGAEETDSPTVDDDQESGPDAAAAQAQDAERQTKARESKGVQKRIDELVKQREEANRRVDYLMGIVAQTAGQKPGQQQTQQQAPAEPQPPREEDFKTFEEFLEAKTDYKAAKAAAEAERKVLAQVQAVMQQERQARQQEAAAKAAQSWSDQGVSKYPDFADVVMSDDLRISPAMRDVILSDPTGHDVAYWLGKNPDITAKISSLPPLRQAQELGRIAARFESNKTQPVQSTPKTTSAPPPIRPSGSKATVSKDPGSMSMDEYMTWRRSQKG